MSKTTRSGGVGFFGLLSIVLITLKLLGKIQISWALALLPLYGPICLLLLIAVLIGSFVALIECFK